MRLSQKSLEPAEVATFVNDVRERMRSSEINDLLENIDESLNWEEQYKTVKNKLIGGISSLRKLKGILPKESLNKCTKPSLKAIFAMVILFGMLFPTPNCPNCRDYK